MCIYIYVYIHIYIYTHNIYTYTIVKGERNPPNTLVAPQKDDESSPAKWWCFHLEKCDADHQDKGYNVDPVNQIAQPCCTAPIFVAHSTQTYDFPAAPTLCCLSSPLVLVRKQHGSARGLSKQDCYMSGCHTHNYIHICINRCKHISTSQYITIYHYVSPYINICQHISTTYIDISTCINILKTWNNYTVQTRINIPICIYTQCILGVLKWGYPHFRKPPCMCIYIYLSSSSPAPSNFPSPPSLHGWLPSLPTRRSHHCGWRAPRSQSSGAWGGEAEDKQTRNWGNNKDVGIWYLDMSV